MTITEKTARDQSETLAFELDLPHTPEKVWRALAEPELVAEWLLPAVNYELAPGAQFEFRAPSQPGWDGVVNCRVLEVQPLRELVYAWVVGDLDTTVTFTLSPTAAGTKLLIVQSGFTPPQKKNFGGARYGWKMMAEKLVTLLGR